MPNPPPAYTFSVAPMLKWTDRHARMFYRQLTQHALLYTEMVTDNAIIHGDAHQHLHFNVQEKPLALQLGGCEPETLAKACQIAQHYDYDEINLNIGCPSDRVQSGRFGACLMADAPRVAECVAAISQTSRKPVTIKCRIGIDEQDSLAFLLNFIETVTAQAYCQRVIIHARKAWLCGLSPKQNRDIPPLNYPRVYEVQRHFPHLAVVINGGITSLASAADHLQHTQGVMLGRKIYQNPYLLAQVDARFFHEQSAPITRKQALLNLMPYIIEQQQQGVRLHQISRHVLGLFNGVSGAKYFRRYLSEHAHARNADEKVLLKAMEHLQWK